MYFELVHLQNRYFLGVLQICQKWQKHNKKFKIKTTYENSAIILVVKCSKTFVENYFMNFIFLKLFFMFPQVELQLSLSQNNFLVIYTVCKTI